MRQCLPLIALLLLPFGAGARESAPVVTSHATATLVAAEDSAAPGKPLHLALRLQLPAGWHTYWLNPGDAGNAPTLTLEGAKAGPLGFPAPERVADAGLVSYVLPGDVWLPFTATPAGAGPLALRAHADFLVCSTICVPQRADLALDLPAGTGAPGADAPRIAAANAALPRPSPFAATLGADGTLRLDAPGLSPEHALFLPEQPGRIDALAPQPLTVAPSGPALHLKLLGPSKDPLAGLLLLTDRTGATTALHVVPRAAAAAVAPAPAGLGRALLLAFLGGLILNLMPCVLPVLSIKALALARLGGAERRHVRAEAALYVAGVLAAFAVIGGATLSLAAAGHAVGWGTQFQSGIFTLLTAWLMLAIGLNMAGLFEIGAGLAGLGQGLAARSAFFTGVLAVVVATPCTGPFMATALAAALALPPTLGFGVFLALGAGLAAPYAMLAAFPGLARFLPRPGPWMLTLRRALSVPMFATAGFFAWVIFAKAGPAGLAAALLGGAALTLGAWAIGRRQRGAGVPRGSLNAGLAVPAAICAAALLLLGHASGGTSRIALAGAEPYSPARLEALRAAHRPVLVDMSAAWCITCLVNERTALAPDTVRQAFARHHVALLQGDWTEQDPAITAFLHEYGRTGVPLYVYFPPSGTPQVLPQILTEAEILGRLGA